MFCENYINSPHFYATFFLSTDAALIFTKNGLGYILGDFFNKTHLVTLLPTQLFN
jgi:hypothetical protein